MCFPMRRCRPVQIQRSLEGLDREIRDAKGSLTEHRVQGRTAEAEQVREELRFFWELRSEIRAKLEDLEEE